MSTGIWRYLLCIVSLLVAPAVPVARASSIVSTDDIRSASLSIGPNGEAVVTYEIHGHARHVLAWGAVNARPPTEGETQVRFTYDYTGGYQTYYVHNPEVRHILGSRRGDGTLTNGQYARLKALREAATTYWADGTCGAYDGPKLAWLVAACKAPDGSYWALQSWQRKLPNYGVVPTASQSNHELHLSHWTGPLPVLTIHTDWAWRRWDHLFGTFSYDGHTVHGFKSTAGGVPLDSWGRNVYLDTFDSVYGAGWKRENSFLAHNPTGAFCYSVNPHGTHPAGAGTLYRATVEGPGVTPDIMWEGPAPGPYEVQADADANGEIAALGDRLCRPN